MSPQPVWRALPDITRAFHLPPLQLHWNAHFANASSSGKANLQQAFGVAALLHDRQCYSGQDRLAVPCRLPEFIPRARRH